MSTFVLSGARLSAGFRAEIERIAGDEVEIVRVQDLRRLGTRALLRRLRSLDGMCIVAVEDPAGEALVPVLVGLAAVSRARTIDVVRGDLSHDRVSRGRAVAALGGLAEGTIRGRRAMRAARRELSALSHAPRIAAEVDGSRVLFVNPNLWLGLQTGGSVAHVTGVVNALTARDYSVTVAAATEPPGLVDGVDLVRLEPPRHLGLPAESNRYRFSRSIPDQLRAVERPSFVYQRHALGSYAGTVLSRRLGVPLVLEYNGPEVWAARHWSTPPSDEALAVAAENASLRHAHLVVTVSQVLADELGSRGVEPERIVWHPNGVDADRFDPARFSDDERNRLRARYGVPADAVLATFVGTFGEWHGAEILARAVREVGDPDIRFLLVGDGPTLPDVRAELAGVATVSMPGLVAADEIPLHLAASDVLVSPHVPNPDGTPFFGSPTKLFEYMASGTAIVASDLDQIGDVLRDDLAVLVQPGVPADLARGIRELAANPDLRRELGSRARTRVLERYAWRHHVDAILEALATRRRS